MPSLSQEVSPLGLETLLVVLMKLVFYIEVLVKETEPSLLMIQLYLIHGEVLDTSVSPLPLKIKLLPD